MPGVLDIPHNPTETLQILTSVITPALLISACGSMLLSTSNRFGRVVDRVRTLHAELEASEPATEEPMHRRRRRELRQEELGRLSQRALLIQRAMIGIHLAIGLFVATSVALGVMQIFAGRFTLVPIVLEMSGAVSLLAGSVSLVLEARLAGISTQKEMQLVSIELAERAARGT